MKNKLKVTNDITFQQIFGKVGNERITKSLLEKILGIEIEEITLDINKQQLGELEGDKVSILDVIAKIGNGTKILIEMQAVKHPYMAQRLLYYWARVYVGGLKRGQDYKRLDKTIAILISVNNLKELEGVEDYHTKWQIREEESNIKLTDELEMHIIELKKFKEDNKRVEGDWIKFIKEGANMEKKVGLDKGLQEAMEQLDRLLADEELVRAYEAREKYLRDKISFETWAQEEAERMGKEGMEKGMEKGMKKGVKQGMKQGMKQGVEQGIEQGKKIGKDKEQREIVQKLKSKNYSIKQISEMLDIEKKEVERILSSKPIP